METKTSASHPARDKPSQTTKVPVPASDLISEILTQHKKADPAKVCCFPNKVSAARLHPLEPSLQPSVRPWSDL